MLKDFRKLTIFYKKKSIEFIEKAILNTNYGIQDSFYFYETFKLKSEIDPIFQNFNLELDYQNQGLNYNTITSSNLKKNNKIRRRSTIKERMLNLNGVKQIETISVNLENSGLRLIDNTKWLFCETYPPKFLIPRNVSDTSLFEICKFRSKSRIPILCYSYSIFTSNINKIKTTKMGKIL